jgi:prefoldin beta subunit
VALPAKLQNEIRQYQRLQQDLAQVQQQRAQLDVRLREAVHTLDELKSIGEDTVLYRPIGNLLVRAKSKKEVEDLLTDDKETLEVRVKALERQENQLRERYTTMTKEITDALQAAGVSPTGASSG